MEDHAGGEAIAHLVAQPRQVPGVLRARGRARLDLDPDQPPARQLAEQVDLMTPLLGAQVVQPRPARRDGELGAQLRRDEGVEHPPEQLAVAHHPRHVGSQRGGDQRRVDQVALGLVDEPLQPVRAPGRDRFGDQQAFEQALVGDGGRLVHFGGVVDRLVVRDPRGVQRVGLEVAAQALPVAAPLLGRLDVVGQQILDVALQPRLARLAAEAQRRLREPAAQRQLHVAAQVGRIGADRQLPAVGEPVEEGGTADTAELLAVPSSGTSPPAPAGRCPAKPRSPARLAPSR